MGIFALPFAFLFGRVGDKYQYKRDKKKKNKYDEERKGRLGF
jgi:hypothetical protein